MTHLIDKDAVVAEINRKRNYEVQWMKRQGYTDYNMGLRDGYTDILSFLDTLEVKEVDLEQEIDDYIGTKEVWKIQEAPLISIENAAKHFFELGLKSKGQ